MAKKIKPTVLDIDVDALEFNLDDDGDLELIENMTTLPLLSQERTAKLVILLA